MASFGPRRKVKIVGQSDARDESDEDIGLTVKRPSRPKPRTSRISFGPGGDDGQDEEPVTIIKPKRGLARKSNLSASTTTDRLPVRQLDDDDVRPSYSKESLAELRNAQQAPPPTKEGDNASHSTSRDLDIANKFGRTLATYEKRDGASLIPTDAEIQEKKARRARMAKMVKYNIQSGDSDDAASGDDRRDSDEDEFLTQRDKIMLRDDRAVRSNEPETRLVRDDEDFMEGLETFTGEDSRVSLGRGAELEAQAKHRAHIQDMLDAAQQESEEEGEDDEDGEDDDREMRNEYEAAQTRKGMASLNVGGGGHERRKDEGARTPPRITPIPTLNSCVERLRSRLLEMEADRAAKLQRMEELDAEKKEIAQREVDIQRLLTETAQKYEALSREAGIVAELPAGRALNGLLLDGQTPTTESV